MVEYTETYIYPEEFRGPEIWEPASVRGYEVSDTGLVRNATTGRILAPRDNGGRVLMVALSYQGYVLSRPIKQLVAEAFIPRPPILNRLSSCVTY